MPTSACSRRGYLPELQPFRARLFPWLYAAARSGRVSGQHFTGRWYNVGTTDELARADDELRASGVQVRS